MTRRNSILLIMLLALLGLGVAAYFIVLRERIKGYQSAAFAVPESAAFVFRTTDWQNDLQVLQNMPWWQAIAGNPHIGSFRSDIRQLDSALSKMPRIRQMMEEREALFVFAPVAANELGLLWVTQTHDKLKPEDISSQLTKAFPNGQLSDHQFMEQRICHWKVKDETLVHYTLIKGLLMASRSPLLIEQGIKAFHKNQSTSTPMVEHLVDMNNSHRLYINYKAMPPLFRTWFRADELKGAEFLNMYSGFGAYQLSLDSGKVTAVGSYFPSDTSTALNLLAGDQPVPMKASEVLPRQTATYRHWASTRFPEWHKEVYRLRNDSVRAKRLTLESELGLTLDEAVQWAPQEWLLATLEPVSQDAAPELLGVLGPAVKDSFMNQLEHWRDTVENRIGSGFLPIDYRGYAMQQMLFGPMLELLYGEAWSGFRLAFYTRIGGYLVISTQRPTLEKAIDAFLADQTLAKSKKHQQFRNQLPTEGNFVMYAVPSRTINLLKPEVRSGYLPQFEQNIPAYKEAGVFGIALAAEGDRLYSQIVMMKAEEESSEPQVVWRSELERPLIGKPYFIPGPEAGGPKDILAFDSAGNVYQFSAAGSLRWKRKLDGLLASDVEVVELYKDGKKQALFITTSRIYMLDEQGQDVAGYPLRLAYKPVTGLLFTKLGDKEIYLIPTESGRIYGYNVDGKPLGGWSPKMLKYTLNVPLKYFSSQGKTYFIGTAQQGTVYILDESGNAFVPPIETKTRFLSTFGMQFGSTAERSTLYNVDTAGVLYSVALDGTVTKGKQFNLDKAPLFSYIDTDGDGRKEFILISGSDIFSYEGETQKWHIATSAAIDEQPLFYNTGELMYIGFSDPLQEQLRLVSRAGTTHPGFPVRGYGGFSIEEQPGTLLLATSTKDGQLLLYELPKGN